MKTIIPLFYENSVSFLDELEEACASGCDLIEIRLDKSLDDVEKLSSLSISKPVIWTIRTDREGGYAHISDDDYEALISQLYSLPGYVDVELSRMPIHIIPERTILSFHDFKKTPDLEPIWQAMEPYHAAVEKIAVMPESEEDVDRLLSSCANHETSSEKIAISMGELGRPSRLEGDKYGSGYTFVTLHSASAPGQISLQQYLSRKLS